MINMSVRISEIYGKDVYSGAGEKIGPVRDVIIDMDEGKAARLTTKEMRGMSRIEVKNTIKDESILYDKVKTIGDIVLLKNIGSRTSRKEESKKETRSKKEGSFSSFMSQ